jgi:hypothetical protein
MGTFGPGPFDNDTGMDFEYDLRVRSNPAERMKFLASALAGLASCDPVEDPDADSTIQQGLAACAIVADKVRSTYYYLREPDDAEDLTLGMIPEIDDPLRNLAIQAVRRALGLAKHPALSPWNTDHAEQSYIYGLGQMIRRLAR